MWRHFRRRFRYYLQFVPLTLNTFLMGAALWIVWYFLYRQEPKMKDDAEFTGTTLRPFILLMAKFAFAVVLVIVALSILSTVLAWVLHIYRKRKQGKGLELEFENRTGSGRAGAVYLLAKIEGVLRPFFGFVKGRLFYDDYRLTERFSLLGNQRRKNRLIRTGISGKSRLVLADIKTYQLRGGFIYFEDMLHLFSFAVPQNVQGEFYQPPVLQKSSESQVAPRKTEETEIRIDQMRRVEGEHLNYKDFESGDDVRRIVWKVYARNRELVVRIPERFEPYASHLYFYASFYTSLPGSMGGEGFAAEMLNHYKNRVWTVYETLAEKEFQMRFIPEQAQTVSGELKDDARVARLISGSDWQDDKALNSYFNPRQGTVLCISSFTDPKDLQQLLDSADSGNMIYYVRLSKTFRQFLALNWLKRLVFLPPRDRLGKLRDRWFLTPFRVQVQRREKELHEILERSGIPFQEV
jgi:hypothetical protein